MKQFPKSEIFSLFSVIAGLVGFALQSWLYSTVDNRGLLPKNHISAIICLLLFAAVAVVHYFRLRTAKPEGEYEQLFPKSPVAAVGCFVAAVGIGISVLNPVATGTLQFPVQICGLLSVAALGFSGYCRLQGKRPNFLLYAVIAVFLLFRVLAFCQKWSAEVQVQNYFFPLLGSLGLLLATYYRAALGADLKNCRHFLFFRQLALFCCLVSMAGGDRLFYLAGALWMATDYCVPDAYGKYAH